ncbi:lytic transglycosylase domain-containing protein [Frigidibacter sp. MR17.24]|uniref:lytic transglycosylase domain-containing protein n=1 Tax=Frigidibacter sp. MR17.24 TaxID=3127345 RepID=UPI003012D854
MTKTALALLAALAFGTLTACGDATPDSLRPNPPQAADVSRMVDDYADLYGVPRSLAHRVVQRESGYNPAARNGTYYGLMQIAPPTARTMGYQGAPDGLLDAATNLKYAVKYLRGAWLVSDGSEDAAVGWYSRGYYYEAKKRGLLKETGLR